MDKEFIPYEQALELKELGFDIPSVSGYSYPDSNNLLTQAILYQQAFRWFRKNHGLYSSILPKKSYPDNYVSGVEWYVTICGGDGVEIGPDGTYTYEEAELECLNKLIEIVGTIELFQHPPVFSENGEQLFFDKEGNFVTSSQTEISDEEEWAAALKLTDNIQEHNGWEKAIKWYKEKLKKKQ